MSTLKLHKTTHTVINDQMVTEMIYSDHPDPMLAKASLVIRMPNERIKNPNETKTARAEVLARALELLNAEMLAHR